MTLEQERAKFAWNKIKSVQGDAFTNLAKGAPALVMGNGLMPSLAFWESREGEVGKVLVTTLLDWLKKRDILKNVEFKSAMEEMVNFDSNKYMLATSETLDFLTWLRQFAAAYKQ